jgi:hypothetical protein
LQNSFVSSGKWDAKGFLSKYVSLTIRSVNHKLRLFMLEKMREGCPLSTAQKRATHRLAGDVLRLRSHVGRVPACSTAAKQGADAC